MADAEEMANLPEVQVKSKSADLSEVSVKSKSNAALKDPGNLFELRKQCYKELQTTLKDLKSRYSQDNENDDLPENASHDDDNIKQLLETVQNQMMMLLYTWEDDYYMAIASLAALRSKDPRTPIGACIVDTKLKVVGIGYNAMPYTPFRDNDTAFKWGRVDGSMNEGKHIQIDKKHAYVCHAAVNAIASRTIPDLTGCTMYITQHPDEDCAHLIRQSDIKEVKYMRNDKRGNPDFEENARQILSLGRVAITQCNPKTEVECTITRKNPTTKSSTYVLTEMKLTKLEHIVDELQKDFKIALHNGERIMMQKDEKSSTHSGGLEESTTLKPSSPMEKSDDSDATESAPPTPASVSRDPKVERKVTTIIQKSTVSTAADDASAHNSVGLEESSQEPLTFRLSTRMQKGDKKSKVRADPKLWLTGEEFFMGLAELQRVYCNDDDPKPQNKVGACIVNHSHQVIAIGGSSVEDREKLAHGKTFSTSNSLSSRDIYAQHAEYKAIASYKGTKALSGCTLYVTTAPCNICAKLIAQSGIVEVVYKKDCAYVTGSGKKALNCEKQPVTYGNSTAQECSKTIFENCSIICRQFTDEFKLIIEQRVDDKSVPVYKWMKTISLSCKKKTMTHQRNTKYKVSWTFEEIVGDKVNATDIILLHSVNIFSENPLGKDTIKFLRSTKDPHYGIVKKLEKRCGHFCEVFSPEIEMKNQKQKPLCKVTTEQPDILEHLTIYFDFKVYPACI